jgi:GNAT superfamily N-acetyltransferase
MIKELGKNEIKQALDLVNRVFSEFVAVDYSEQGNKTFNDYLQVKYEEVSNDMQTGHKRIWGYYHDGEIVGVIATRDISHIALMFVDKKHHRQGIAKKLYNVVISEVEKNTDITQLTVNSSPYAVAAYERLGFVKTDLQQEKDGIIYVPMKHIIHKL